MTTKANQSAPERLPSQKPDPGNPAFIPGLTQAWSQELGHRLQEIQSWNQVGKLAKFSPFSSPNSEQVTGQSLAKHGRASLCQPLVKRLKTNPTDVQARSKLVALVSDLLQDPPPDLQLELMLQAAVAQQLGAYRIENIQTALRAEEGYLKTLLGLARFQFKKEQEEYKRLQALPAKKAEAEPIHRRLLAIKGNAQVLQSYLNQRQELEALTLPKDRPVKVKALKILPPQTCFRSLYRLPDLQDLAFDKQGQWREYVENAAPVVENLRYHSLLFPVGMQLPQAFLKLKRQEVLGHLLKGRLELSRMLFLLAQSQGLKRQDLQNQARQVFMQSMHSYGAALKAAEGEYEAHPGGLAALVEWGHFVLLFVGEIAPHLGMPLPEGWAEDNLQRVRLMAKQSGSNDEEVQRLLTKLGQAQQSPRPQAGKAQGLGD